MRQGMLHKLPLSLNFSSELLSGRVMYFDRKLIFAVLMALCAPGHGQNPNLEPDKPAATASLPTITFTFELPQAEPEHFSISVGSAGRAAYQSTAPGRPDSPPGEPFMVKFYVSRQSSTRIFDLAKSAHYFQGDFAYTKSRIANLGAKTLAFTDGSRHFETSYNWSENPAIQELTRIFLGISNTLEAGHRLAYLKRFDRLGLDAELKRMEEMAKENKLEELQAIAPVLREISSDPAIMKLARERAQRLLQRANGSSAAGSGEARLPPSP